MRQMQWIRWTEHFLAEREKTQPVATGPLFLLLGCTLGMAANLPQCSARYAGVAAVGAGDAVAAIVGVRFGRIRLRRWSGMFRAQKSLEGSLALALTTSGMLWILCGLDMGISIVVVGAVAAMAEASLEEDNLMLAVCVTAVCMLLY